MCSSALTEQGLTSFTAFQLYQLIKTSFQEESSPKSPPDSIWWSATCLYVTAQQSLVSDCGQDETVLVARAAALISIPAPSELREMRQSFGLLSFQNVFC